MPPDKPHALFGIKMVLLSVALSLISGCTYQRGYPAAPVEPPQEIYLAPDFQPIQNARILITSFKAPGYAGDAGIQAAFALFSELQVRRPETDIVFESTLDDSNHERLFAYARANRFDLIISGNVLFLLDGGISTASRVEEIIRVFAVYGDRLHPVAYAKAFETVAPVPEADFIVAHGRGKAAPSALSLLKRHAVRFSRLVSDLIPGEE